ncbi:MAG: pantothenate kinase [Leptolyngbya sp. IPPAS B-1204]|nr:pantothenate kinase [Elainella sp. C42_A2020_010]RNJ69562.1 MAG: pantothenate kinase [Leptolyngbya sp. IPPAS B-1204]
MADSGWLALMIGNSRLHWAWFRGITLQQAWDTPHFSSELIADLTQHQFDFAACAERLTAELPIVPNVLPYIPASQPLWLASVIPAQVPLWQAYPQTQVITLAAIPITGLYPTLGIDRALALLGAATIHGLPSLIIDAGTGLTFTGANAEAQLVGGAILPGLRLQLRSLAEHTAALPHLSNRQVSLPQRWSTNTDDAIWSGVLYSLLAGIRDFVTAWQQQFSRGAILLTGGDASLLIDLLRQQAPDLAAQIKVDPNLIFWGIRQMATQL